MKFMTDLLYTQGVWQLWFTEVRKESSTSWMSKFVEYKFPVKPTKKQIRKLRREFRKF